MQGEVITKDELLDLAKQAFCVEADKWVYALGTEAEFNLSKVALVQQKLYQ